MRTLLTMLVVACGCAAGCPSLKADDLQTLTAKVAAQDKRLKDVEKKLEGVDSKLDAILVAVSAKPKATALAPVPVTQPPSALRTPVGHTHTCANGHTWDHTMDNGTHVCPVCRLPQTSVDTVPRMVGNTQSQPLSYSLQQSSFSSGCANGSCGVLQTERRGLFGFRRR